MREHHLDGLRGWAALFVVFGHIGPMFLLANQRLEAIPFFWDGQLAVYVFFVLSGFVLSIGHFKEGARSAAILQAVRRYPRLTLPIFASCAIAVALQKLGVMYNIAAGDLVKSEWLESFYRFEMTWTGLFQFAAWDVYARYDGTHTYNAVLWTMPFEMLGSLLIFGLLFLSGKNRICQCISIISFMAWAVLMGSPLFAFGLGMAIAFASAVGQDLSIRFQSNILGGALVVAALTISLHRSLGGGPLQLSLYAAMVVLAVQLSPIFQGFLSTRLSKWLGAVSFPLYLTHLLLICSISSYMVLALADSGTLTPLSRIVIALTTVCIALIVATAFAPVERLAIRASRYLSRAAMSFTPISRRVINSGFPD